MGMGETKSGKSFFVFVFVSVVSFRRHRGTIGGRASKRIEKKNL